MLLGYKATKEEVKHKVIEFAKMKLEGTLEKFLLKPENKDVCESYFD